MEYIFRTVSEYPEDWDVDQIEGFLNVSSSCANNRLRELADRYLTDEEDEMCVCHLFEGRFVREATENDLYVHIPNYKGDKDHSYKCPKCGWVGRYDEAIVDSDIDYSDDEFYSVCCPVCWNADGGEFVVCDWEKKNDGTLS